jgi:hypothetical protein
MAGDENISMQEAEGGGPAVTLRVASRRGSVRAASGRTVVIDSGWRRGRLIYD